MSDAPTTIGGRPVLLSTPIDDRHRPTGGCRHLGPDGPFGPASGLAICAEGPDSFLLFRCDGSWMPFADTWHPSIEEARRQAEFEYEGSSATWSSGVAD